MCSQVSKFSNVTVESFLEQHILSLDVKAGGL